MCWFNNIPKNKGSVGIPRSNNTQGSVGVPRSNNTQGSVGVIR